MSSKKEEVFGENATGINTMFNKCNIKIPNFENELTSISSTKQVSVVPEQDDGFRWKDIRDESYLRNIKNGLNKNGDFKIINFDEGYGSHAIIVVKDDMLPKGWGFFDANGKEGFKDSILRFHDEEGADVTDEYLTVSPNGAFNPAYFIGLKKDLPKNINPGFCGIFGIIFMAFYTKHRSERDWISQWSRISNCLLKPYTPKKGPPYKFSLVVAREVLKIINGRGGKATKVNKINDVLDQACAFIGESPSSPAPQDEEEILAEISEEISSPRDVVIEESSEVSCNEEPSGFSCAIMGGGKRKKKRGTLYVSPSNKRSAPPKKVMKILKQQVNISKKLANAKTTKKERKKLLNKRISLKKEIKTLKRTMKKGNKSRK